MIKYPDLERRTPVRHFYNVSRLCRTGVQRSKFFIKVYFSDILNSLIRIGLKILNDLTKI